jgi:hypothetical protein
MMPCQSGRSKGFDDDRSGAGGGEAVLVGGDVVDCVGCGLRCVDLDGAAERADVASRI